MEFYWELIEHDGTITHIPPEAVETVKRRWDNKDPIHTSTGSIPANQIKTFRVSEKRYSKQPLLEAAAQAFNEPQLTADGSVVCKWVKKLVPQQAYNKFYGASPGYRNLGGQNGMVIVAWRQPVHQIDPASTEYCNAEEIRRLTM